MTDVDNFNGIRYNSIKYVISNMIRYYEQNFRAYKLIKYTGSTHTNFSE